MGGAACGVVLPAESVRTSAHSESGSLRLVLETKIRSRRCARRSASRARRRCAARSRRARWGRPPPNATKQFLHMSVANARHHRTTAASHSASCERRARKATCARAATVASTLPAGAPRGHGEAKGRSARQRAGCLGARSTSGLAIKQLQQEQARPQRRHRALHEKKGTPALPGQRCRSVAERALKQARVNYLDR